LRRLFYIIFHVKGDSHHLMFTCELTKAPIQPLDTVSILKDDTVLVLPSLTADPVLSVHMQIRTADQNGLLLYNNGADGDFVAIELMRVSMRLYILRTRVWIIDIYSFVYGMDLELLTPCYHLGDHAVKEEVHQNTTVRMPLVEYLS